MLSKSSRASIGLLSVALIATATVSIVPQSAIAAHARHLHHHTYLHHRGTWLAGGATLPYGPEYGFLPTAPARTPYEARVIRLSRAFGFRRVVRSADERLHE